MTIVTKEDLKNRGKYSYNWNASPGDNPNIIGKPDSNRVSKREGYEVVDFINAYAKRKSLSGTSAAQKIEDLLHKSDKVMRADLNAYIDLHW